MGFKRGDRYYYFDDYDGVSFSTWNDIDVDITRRYFGNCFLTKEEVEFEVERRKVEAILLKYGRRGFKYSEDNYYIFYERDESSIVICCYESFQDQGVIYFDTEELCQKAIEEAGKDNIKKYIFGIEQ